MSRPVHELLHLLGLIDDDDPSAAINPGDKANRAIRVNSLSGLRAGALTASAPVAVSVGVASGQAVAINASRKGLVAINTSSVNISLAFGQAAVLNSGITLTPNGAFEMDPYTFSTAAMFAIAAGAASNLAVQEYT